MGTYLLLVKEFPSDYPKICSYTKMILLVMRHDNVVIFTSIPYSLMTSRWGNHSLISAYCCLIYTPNIYASQCIAWIRNQTQQHLGYNCKNSSIHYIWWYHLIFGIFCEGLSLLLYWLCFVGTYDLTAFSTISLEMKDPNPSIFRMQHTQLLAYSREKIPTM